MKGEERLCCAGFELEDMHELIHFKVFPYSNVALHRGGKLKQTNF